MQKIKTIYKNGSKTLMTLKLNNRNFINIKSPTSINDICINEIVISNKFPLCKKDKWIFIFIFLLIFHSFKKWGYIKDILIKLTEGMYFMIKFEKTFGKYVTICGKVGNIIKEI